MLDQSFSFKNFRRLIISSDIGKFDIAEDAKRVVKLKDIVTKVNTPDYNFSPLNKILDNGNIIYSPSTVEDEFALRKLNDNLKRLYKFKPANRNLIVEQIGSLLLEEVPMAIIKLDIKKFYETIDKYKICKKLIDDPLLSFGSKQILKKFFLLTDVSFCSGLPRGINISSALSEILMRDFDKKISQQSGVYFYARYVDDIIIFTFKNPKEIIKTAGEILFYETELKLNHQKTKLLERHCRCTKTCMCVGVCRCHKHCKCSYEISKNLFFEYLGYRFSFSDIPKYSTKLEIAMSKSKINKIKTRIILSFRAFMLKGDFQLLERRIGFLTSNFIVKSNINHETLNAGIYYNYPYINDTGMIALDMLTLFLRKTINSKNTSFGRKLNTQLTPANKQALAKYCFKAGFVNRRLKKYSPIEIKKIKKCWTYG